MEDLQTEAPSKSTVIELGGDEFWPLSGKPYFHIVLASTHVNRVNQLLLPVKIHAALPSAIVPAYLTYKGKTWEIIYNGKNPTCKRFDSKWKNFVDDNALKIGDACVFELTECSNDFLKFRVQILRGEIPPEFANKSEYLDTRDGESEDNPIMIR